MIQTPENLEHNIFSNHERLHTAGIEVVLDDFHQKASELLSDFEAIGNGNLDIKKPIYNESITNARTVLFEKLTASGHLSVVEFAGDQQYIHEATMLRLLRGMDRRLPAQEYNRRFLEICEELKIENMRKRILSGELPEDTKILTFSNCIQDTSEKMAYALGYRVLNRKGMIRTVGFSKKGKGYTRVLEQLSVSNSDDGTVENWLTENNVNTCERSFANRSELVLGQQLYINNRLFDDGVISVARSLDQYRHKTSGIAHIYGAPTDHAELQGRVDYSQLREQSRAKEERASVFIDELESYGSDLELKKQIGEISQYEVQVRYNKKLDDIIRRICMIESDSASARGYVVDAYGYAALAPMTKMRTANIKKDKQDYTTFAREFDQVKDSRLGVACGGPKNEIEHQADFEKSQTDKESWKTTMGKCVIPNCPTNPDPTEVGPCGVCMNFCQPIFDGGGSPYWKSSSQAESNQPSGMSLLLGIEITPILSDNKIVLGSSKPAA
jgi:hypothetical protein